MPPGLVESMGLLTAADRERLKWCFDQGEPAYSKIPMHDGWYVGVNMDGLPFMEIIVRDGSWGIGRKRAG